MKVQLTPQTQPSGKVQAAFLRGTRLLDWLPELNRWGISIDELACYLVPTSLADRRPAGLLVVLPEGNAALPVGDYIPCSIHHAKLVIPLDAALSPAMTDTELGGTLHFPLQFLHPSLGMVGWEIDEKLDFGLMVQLASPTVHDWSHAHPGNAAAPPLHDVKVPQPTMEETLAGLLSDLDPQPLDGLEDKQPPQDDSAFGRFMKGLFKGGQEMTKGIQGQLPTGGQGGDFLGLGKLSEWLGSMSDGLESQRSNAIDKLLDLFDKDPLGALKYAIPLDNPFQSRGTGQGTGQLSERDTSFNFGKIGGGMGGNTWNVAAERMAQLRERYVKAANDAVAAGEFEKAAYIYAHLLHDLHGAANVLQQGRLYREAAAIYREYLKNLPMAAECLEKGGLYLDAIDLYIGLERWEKAGDLYRVIGKRKQADQQYERCVTAALEKNDFLEAARLEHAKLGDAKRASATLLRGYQDEKQGEACLLQYFPTVALVPDVDMAEEIAQLYAVHTPPARHSAFIRILSEQVGQLQADAALQTAKTIAYEVLSREALAGNVEDLHLLRKFVLHDALVAGDVSRYAARATKAPRNKPITPPQLNKNIHWLEAQVVSNQLLAVGHESNHLWMARFNWQGHVEYYHWPETVSLEDMPKLVSAPQSEFALLCTRHLQPFSKKVFPVNERFTTAITIASPDWLSGDGSALAGLGMLPNGDVVSLVDGLAYSSLRWYSSAGQLRSEHPVKMTDDASLQLPQPPAWQLLVGAGDKLFLRGSHHVYMINARQEVASLPAIHDSLCMDIAHEEHMTQIAIGLREGWLQLSTEPSAAAPIAKDARATIPLLKYLPGKLLVLATRQDEVMVYATEGESPRLEMRLSLSAMPTAIIAGPQRRSFCLLYADGKIDTHVVEEHDMDAFWAFHAGQ